MKMTSLNKKIGVALLAFSAATMTGCSGYSEGGRTGVVTKFSKKGLVCKTWEGELAMLNQSQQGYGEGKTLSHAFQFSAIDDKVAEKLIEARDTGARVTLTYDQGLFHNPCERDTDYVITDVKLATAKKENKPSLLTR